MPTTPDRTHPILVGYDGSASSEVAMHWAFAEAERRGADLTVLQSWHEPIFSERTWMERWNDPAGEEREATELLRAAIIQAHAGRSSVSWAPLLVSERPGPALIAASEDHQLVVLGSRGRGGFGGLALGSVAEHVAAASVAPVAIIRHDAPGAGPITVGLDGSASSRRALRWAVSEAQVRSAPVRAVLVWSDLISIGLHGAEPLRATSTAADARITLNQVLREELGPDHGGVHGDAVCGGQAARALLDASEGSAMLVLGAPAHDERARHLGGTAHQVVRHASCPVVIAR